VAEAAEKLTPSAPQAYFSETARTEMRLRLERKLARRKSACMIDWDSLWDELEIMLRTYAKACSQLELSPSPSEVIAALEEIRASIKELLRKFSVLPEQNFISDAGELLFDAGSWAAAPLTPLLEEVEARADALRELGRAHVHGTRGDYEAELKRVLFRIGEDLLGWEISRTGPLVTFVRLALRPVLGNKTPNNDALFQFAIRERTRRRPPSLFQGPE
jgi:hypothetical protein